MTQAKVDRLPFALAARLPPEPPRACMKAAYEASMSLSVRSEREGLQLAMASSKSAGVSGVCRGSCSQPATKFLQRHRLAASNANDELC